MKRPAPGHLSGLLGLPLLLALTACLPEREAPPPDGFEIQAVELEHAVALAPGETALAPAERTALADFLARNGGAGTTVRVDAEGPSAADAQAVVLGALRGMAIGSTAGHLAPGAETRVRVAVVRQAYLPRACRADAEAAVEGGRPLGCSNALNLARMVDAPADLTAGRPLGPAPAGPVARAALRYLEQGGEATLSEATSDTKASSVSSTAAPSPSP
ncbi:hypothetical protein GCM10011611_08670 [Aliidongia dinghuensis]|uniref:Pilus assembly protein CpaD n=1 Tax=Aliidongia dinghuensis TaxID=1867774 RepID=A0A8J2YQM0_9PROT|nr:CpaD family pilus assembly lipoprotein [Aliidongia dinghuensis]GGF05422.1 hypothetical protein GCM10011611_08670 [Aliidongia dinghuensis]